MILALPIIISLIIGFLTGGSLAGAAGIRFRWLPLLVAALMVQVLIFTPILGTHEVVHEYGPSIYIGSMLAILVAIALNLDIPGVKVIAVGAALNTLAIVTNGGYMPSPEAALNELGFAERVRVNAGEESAGSYVLTNSKIADENTRFAFLGDIYAMPDWAPLANVISIGDAIIAIGAGVAILRVMHRRPEQLLMEESPAFDATQPFPIIPRDITHDREPVC